MNYVNCFWIRLHCLLCLFLVAERPAPEETVTSSFGRFIQTVQPKNLTPTVLQRSKRMVLDSIGVGLLGSTTEVFDLALQHCQVGQGPTVNSKYYKSKHVCVGKIYF